MRLTFLGVPHTKRQSNLEVVTFVYSGRFICPSVRIFKNRTDFCAVCRLVRGTYTAIVRANLVLVSIV